MTTCHGAKLIARKLIATALGNAYYGNALRFAKDMPFFSADEDQQVLQRWIDGSHNASDGFALQDISNKLLATTFNENTDKSITSFQARVSDWITQCFGESYGAEREVLSHRFLEESLELIQACGCSASVAHQLVDYVFARPVGEPHQEAGGVMVTLAALCAANNLDIHADAETELARVCANMDVIRARQLTKPKFKLLEPDQ